MFQNVTLTSDIKYNSVALLDLNTKLEYSNDQTKNLVVAALIEKKRPIVGKEYSISLLGKHPASR